MVDIKEIENLLIKEKEWKYLGEVDSKKRPVNSLLTLDEVAFDQNKPTIILNENMEAWEKMVLRKVKDKEFSNYKYSKINPNIDNEVEFDMVDAAPCELDKDELTELFEEIDHELTKMTDIGGAMVGVFSQTEEEKEEVVEKINIKKKQKKTKRDNKDLKYLRQKKNVTII
ncbi:U3 small nucleolar RNA-associated protein MPP10 [Astathelohania contejeani]|uniref:U3 small nucleolar RNA-associated protein MPP10 n=1 Tax=Astathelohania contejeani TaxID=164912 RepID=A0ABQ7HXJ3_9MICR|nr:U3 small nucleolar RNA-associated protein MPP10 [Thelohania contejeani]